MSNPDMVHIKEIESGFKVSVMFEGDLESVKKAVLEYVKDYPEAGYMTHIIEEGQNLDGSHYCKIWRLASCD